MKKFALILILVFMSSKCAGAELKPVIVRDKFTESGYWVYVPADSDGEYWSRWCMNWRGASSPLNRLYPIREVWYGIVYEGQTQKAADATKGGSWSELISNGWHLQRTTTAGATLTFTIPATHNRIHLWALHGPAKGRVTLTLDGSSSGLDVNDVNLGDYTDGYFKETVISTHAAGTSLVITTVGASTFHDIIGIQTFDDDKLGNPATASGGIAVGHDLIDLFHYEYYYTLANNEISGFAKRIFCEEEATDLTISWGPAGQAQDWTSYVAHFGMYGSGGYPFRATTEPTLYIDGVSKGVMYDVDTIPLGTLFQGDNIGQHIEGFGDFNGDQVEDAEDVLKLRMDDDFTRTGLGIAIKVNWTGNANCTNIFAPTVPISTNISGKIKFLPDETEVAIGSEYDKRGNSISVYPDGINCVVHVTSSGPVGSICAVGIALNNAYFKMKNELLEGGSSPDNGDTWTFGNHFQILKERLAGDLNDDSKVNFVDLSILAENWLECDLVNQDNCLP